ncbi:MAG: type II toxin-antitoxin system RelE/ParE family toxin [bacterium]
MPNTVALDRQAEKFLEKLSDQRLYIRLREQLKSLVDHPFPQGSKRLTNTDHLYRLRVGDYRIVYQFFPQQAAIKVLLIDHRKNVYRKLP